MEITASWWVGFHLLLLALLAADLGLFHRRPHQVTLKESLIWTGLWVLVALLFNAAVYRWLGARPAIDFLTGYLVEKALAVDNLFVFLTVFAYFQVPAAYQHKVLTWGILGALLFRGAFIFAGVELIERFHWMVYVFGGLLMFTAVKMLLAKGKSLTPNRNPAIRLLRRMAPVSDRYHEDRFFVRHSGRWMVTPLFVVLVFVELTDLLFAIDSIPAAMAITLDPFIIYTSNALAILGLRSLYFALSGLLDSLVYLHYGLAAILGFVGGKMLAMDIYKLDSRISLAVVAGILTLCVIASLVHRRASRQRPGAVAIQPRETPTAGVGNCL